VRADGSAQAACQARLETLSGDKVMAWLELPQIGDVKSRAIYDFSDATVER
jgi:hypothetical protein